MAEDGTDGDARSRMVMIAGLVSCAIATIALGLRMFTRIHINRQVGIDDWLAITSLFCAYGMAISQGINAIKSLGRHQWEINPTQDTPGFYKIFWITTIFYNTTLMFIKLTFLFQYFRVFRQIQNMRTTYIIAMIGITGWNVGQIIAIIFTCAPIAGFWDKTIDATCQNGTFFVYLNTAGNILTDLIILLLPVPALWKLHLPNNEKIAVIGIFGIGSITVVISVLRLTTILPDSSDDLTYDTWMSACYSIAELASGITCAALATLRPLITRVCPFIFPQQHDANIGFQLDSRHPPTIGSGPSEMRFRRKTGGHARGWTVDICDDDLKNTIRDLPEDLRSPALTRHRDETITHQTKYLGDFQMLEPGLGSQTRIEASKPDDDPILFELEEVPTNDSWQSGIMVEKEFGVLRSETPSKNSRTKSLYRRLSNWSFLRR